jgi:predicted nucleotidyltransferase/lambda repressor-like predicted transcriptional regulator
MAPASAAALVARIAQAAKARGLSRRALARRAGVRPETVSRIASRGTSDFGTLERLAAAAGLRLGLEGVERGAAIPMRDQVLGKRSLIRTIAKAHGARSVELFGSAARGEELPDSDLDFMVELEPGRSLLDLIGMAHDLQDVFGRKVEVMTRRGTKPRVLAQARRDAVRVI